MLGISLGIWDGARPSKIIKPNLALWLRRGGASGATWSDSSGNGRTMTLNGSPTVGATSVTFNGTSQWGNVASSVLPASHTLYMRVKPIVWTAGAYLFSGQVGRASIAMKTATPTVAYTDSVAAVQASGNATLGAFHSVCGTFDIAAGAVSLNIDGVTATGTVANTGASTITVAARQGGASGWANIEVVEVIAYTAIHNPTEIARMIAYLNTL